MISLEVRINFFYSFYANEKMKVKARSNFLAAFILLFTYLVADEFRLRRHIDEGKK